VLGSFESFGEFGAGEDAHAHHDGVVVVGCAGLERWGVGWAERYGLDGTVTLRNIA
jgi:hypothetical protein